MRLTVETGERESSGLTMPEKISSLLPVSSVLSAKDEVVEVTAVISRNAASLGIARQGVGQT